MVEWHIWTINHLKIDAIKIFLAKDVPEVGKIFFPTTPRACVRRGRVSRDRVPLYFNYLFLYYEDSESVYYRMKDNPFIYRYVGVCKQEEVEAMVQKEGWNTTEKRVEVGDYVEVMYGPMATCKGNVFSVSGNKAKIRVRLFGRETEATFLVDDLEIIEKYMR